MVGSGLVMIVREAAKRKIDYDKHHEKCRSPDVNVRIEGRLESGIY